MVSHLFIIVFNVPGPLAMWPVISLLLYLMFPLRWRCGQSSLYYCISCSRFASPRPLRFAGDVVSHLFIIVFHVPASLLPARFASLAMWSVISLLLYFMFPLRFSPPASLRWRCGQSSLYYCISCSRFASLAMWSVISLLLYFMFPLRFAGDVVSHLFIIVFHVPASLLPARFVSLAMWPVISLLLYFMFPLRFAGDVVSHLFIIVFHVPASLLPARFAPLATWSVISLLLYFMFPLRFSPAASLPVWSLPKAMYT